MHIMCARVREASTVRKSVPARWRLTRRAGRRWGKGEGGRTGACARLVARVGAVTLGSDLDAGSHLVKQVW